jgi:hypothetical protein
MSRKRESTASRRPFLDSNFKHGTRGMYLDIRSNTLYIAIRTRGYLKHHQSLDLRSSSPNHEFSSITWSKLGHVKVLISMPEINKKIQKGNWNCRGEEKYHLLLVQPHFKCYRLISPQVQWMLHHEWALTICCPTCVYKYFQIRILGKLTMSTRISDIGQVHNLDSGRLVVCCSIAPEVWQHQQPARIQILVRVQNYNISLSIQHEK